MEIPFFKYHGTGNDFVLIDNRKRLLTGNEHAAFAAACHRRFGIGADGVILLNTHAEYDFEMDYFNSDGNRSSMCGNGGRCIVQFAHDLGLVSSSARFLAVDGEHIATIGPSTVKLQMTNPSGYQQISETDFWVHTGSPHFVRFVEGDIALVDVFGVGRAIRNSLPWSEQGGTNVNFVQYLGESQVAVRTYERGVEDETWSCGTGVTAVAAVMHQFRGTTAEVVRIQTLGGVLQVHLPSNESPWLEGPAKFVFQGTINLD